MPLRCRPIMNNPVFSIKRAGLWLLGVSLLTTSVWAGEVTFAAPRALGERGREFCVGDFDNDGDPDLGVSKSGLYRYVYQNDGRKSPGYADDLLWENENPSLFGDDPTRNHYAVDINGDGVDDWLICPPYAGVLVMQLSSGKNPVTFEVLSVSYGHTISAGAPGDLDGDGNMDIVIFHQNPEMGVTLLKNTGKDEPRFEEVPIDVFSCINLGGRIHVADLNGDGANDIILSYSCGDIWYENDGQAQPGFTKHEINCGGNYSFSGRIATADLNGDGYLDVIIGNKFLINDGEKNPQFQVGDYRTAYNPVNYLDTGDLDGDGDVDVIAYTSPARIVSWYENDGGVIPTLTQHEFHQLETDYDDVRHYDVKMLDIDQDGDLDVIMAYTVETAPYRYKEQVFLFENLLKSPKDVGLFTPRKGDLLYIDQFMAVKWRSELDTSGPSVRFELYQDEIVKVADLGQDMNEEGQGWFTTLVPRHLPTREDYRIRIVSLADEQYTAFSEAFTIIGNTAVAPVHFELYE